MSRLRFRIAATVLVVLGPMGSIAPVEAGAQAPVVHAYAVSPAGNDAAAGTADAPWRTLVHSFAALGPGDTLTVRGGTYRERVTGLSLRPGTASQRVLVRAAAGERPVLQGLLQLDAPDYWSFDGLNVEWDPATGKPDEHMVRILNGTGWEFKDAEISGARSYAAVLIGGTTTGQPSNWTLSDNCIHDTMPTNDKNQDQLVYVNSGVDAGRGAITHNLLFGAHNGAGVKLAGPESNTGGAAGVTVSSNTIYDTVQSVLVGGRSHDNDVEFNILVGTRRATGIVRAFQLTGERNRLFANLAAGADRLVFSDPGFRSLDTVGSSNRFPVDPRFDSVAGCEGFHARNPSASGYGRYAEAGLVAVATRGAGWLMPLVWAALVVVGLGFVLWRRLRSRR